jgi:hypothetical protein
MVRRDNQVQLTPLTDVSSMPKSSRTLAPDNAAGRRRKTVVFNADALLECLADACSRECAAHARGEARWTAATHASRRPERLDADVREQLLALLKAFCDAAQPAGGLLLDALNEPADLHALRAAAQANLLQGDVQPKLLIKVRAGRPVDLRIAVAALHFFRLTLARSDLTLQHIGGTETERQQAVKRIERALVAASDGLPHSVYEGLSRRASETAGYSYIMRSTHVHYGGLREFVDPLGLRRMQLLRTTRYTPVRLNAFAGRLAPHKAYEWYDWNHVVSVRLFVRPVGDASSARVELPLQRSIDESQGVIRIDIDPTALPAQLELLVVPAGGVAETAVSPLEITWEEEIVLNPADRDIVAWYSPVDGLDIEFDSQLTERLLVSAGDSPGLRRTALGWRLDRTLMPREVLAVRMRPRELPAHAAMQLGAGGEWPVSLAPGVFGGQLEPSR